MNPFSLEPTAQAVQTEGGADPLEQEIQNSVTNFAARFGALRSVAEMNGWIKDYETEIRRLVKLAREAK